MIALADVAIMVEQWLPPGAWCVAGEIDPAHVRVVAHGAPSHLLVTCASVGFAPLARVAAAGGQVSRSRLVSARLDVARLVALLALTAGCGAGASPEPLPAERERPRGPLGPCPARVPEPPKPPPVKGAREEARRRRQAARLAAKRGAS